MTARVVIIGAGLGGLTAGIALRQYGFEVAIFEQAARLDEVGAGLSLSQAAFSVYRALGLANEIESAATITAGMAFLHYRTGALLAGAMDLGQGSGDPESALAARQMHRADLQRILAAAYLRAGGVMTLGHRLVDLDRREPVVTAVFSNGSTSAGDIVIGADGLRSQVRALLWGAWPARFTQQTAYRFLVPIETARPFLQFGRSAVFQGPGRVFNRYTIRQGSLLNCVGIVKTEQWQDDGWSIPADRDEVLAGYKGWHPDVTGLIERGERMIKWGLFDRPALPRWSQGRVTLLGDAAHPMLPFLGLGAAMAIEDAMILARALRDGPDIEPALARYEAARRPRSGLVQDQSVRQGALVQSGDPDRFDAARAPSHDPAFYAYDPVRAAI
jgi:salicylate hydroxylase